ncbi:unnamed protein product [Protopolystoma xenopodis]|uniref:Uncharacterized protein n=1 Tax=Protopolystoma xenopodis TaxID=117903 RepID=A0A448X662_9PLAT|nr:unnamed protein product [Protopolystoma xenopodis]
MLMFRLTPWKIGWNLSFLLRRQNISTFYSTMKISYTIHFPKLLLPPPIHSLLRSSPNYLLNLKSPILTLLPPGHLRQALNAQLAAVVTFLIPRHILSTQTPSNAVPSV